MLGLTALEFFIASVAVFALVYWITPAKFNWVSFIVLVALLTLLAFKFSESATDDLTRYYFEIDYMRDRGKDEIDRAIEEDLYGFKTFRVALYFFYFVSLLPDNHYLPAITIFVIYGLMFLVMYKAIRRFSISKGYAFIGIMFFISTYWYYDVFGIRNALAFAIAFACSYYHLVERKNIPLCYAGYVIAAFTHSSGIIVVLLALFTEFTLNNSGKFINILFVLGAALSTPAASFLADRTDNGFIDAIAGKTEHYAAVEDLSNVVNYPMNIKVNIVVFVFLSMFFLYIKNNFLISDYSARLKRLYKYFSFTLFFLVGALASSLVFMRLVRFILPIVGALIIMIGLQLQKEQIVNEEEDIGALVTPVKTSLTYQIRVPVISAIIAFTGVHFWYLCAGSSLNWIRF